jgi:hypothetical protein
MRVNDPKDSGRATLDRPAPATGRDGAIDLAARTDALDFSEAMAVEEKERFSRAMGAAVVALWGELPQPVQEQLFECAVVLGHHGERDEMLREQLAKFLHDHHERTRPKE